MRKLAPIMLVACIVAVAGCGGAPQGIPDASPDQITMADPAVTVSEGAGKYVAFVNAVVQESSDKYNVKVSLKASAEIPWNAVFVLYEVRYEQGSEKGLSMSNFKGVKGPVSAGTPIDFALTIYREKPGGKRAIVITEVTQINPAP